MTEQALHTATSAESPAETAARRFLHREAELLDNRALPGWLELIATDIDYRVPVRTGRSNSDGLGFSLTSFFMEEDYASLKTRVERLGSEFAWAENPATRTRRMVTNIRVRQATSSTIDVASNLAVFCYRGKADMPLILTAEREDVLAREGQDWRLRKRLVLFDATILGLESLSIFL